MLHLAPEQEARQLAAIAAEKDKWAAKGTFKGAMSSEQWAAMGAEERRAVRAEQKFARKDKADVAKEKQAKKAAKAAHREQRAAVEAKLQKEKEARGSEGDGHPASASGGSNAGRAKVVGWRHLDAKELGAAKLAEGAISDREAFGASFGPRAFAFDLSPQLDAEPPRKQMKGMEMRLTAADGTLIPVHPLQDTAGANPVLAAAAGKKGHTLSDVLGDSDDEGEATGGGITGLLSAASSPGKSPLKMPSLQTSLDAASWKTALHSLDYQTPRHDLYRVPIQQAGSSPLRADHEWSVSLDVSKISDMGHLIDRQATEVTSSHALTAAQKEQHHMA